MPRGVYERKPRQSTYPLKKKLRCGACLYIWEYRGISSSTNCPLCGKKIDARNKREYSRQYMARHPERLENLYRWYKSYSKEDRQQVELRERKSVLVRIAQKPDPECSVCGCDDIRLLEVNHKNGGGGQELKKGKNATKFYRDIVALRRGVDDLEILCRLCNAKHYLEQKYGQLPIHVIWKGYYAL